MIVAIEGIDGSGKHTTASALRDQLVTEGRTVELLSFPRYGLTAASRVITDHLNGNNGPDLDVYTVASYYALDRFESRATLLTAHQSSDVLILDRYVASNIAYQGARLTDAQLPHFIQWVRQLEHGTFGLPVVDHTILLKLPLTVARERVGKKPARDYTDLDLDRYESDNSLQFRAQEIYEQLARNASGDHWIIMDVLAGEIAHTPEYIANEIIKHIT